MRGEAHRRRRERGNRIVQEHEPQQSYRARVVLLGASNLTRGIAVVVETARQLLGSPLDIHVAAGHGRSYGRDTLVLARRLPSILDSSVWQALRTERAIPTYGLITDIGNDIMLGVEPEVLVRWIGRCVSHLQEHDTRIVMTAPPMSRLRRLSPPGFIVSRTLMFPGNRMARQFALDRAHRTEAMLRTLTARFDIPLVTPSPAWYGLDPIHIRLASRGEAWATVLGHWLDSPPPPSRVRAKASPIRWARLRTSSPDRWWLFGRIPRGRHQPSIRLPDGTTISLW